MQPARPRLAWGFARARRRAPHRTGQYDPLAEQAYSEADFDVVYAVRSVASAWSVTSSGRIALAIKKVGRPAPIVGAIMLTHIEDAVAAVNLNLRREISLLEAPYRMHCVLGHR